MSRIKLQANRVFSSSNVHKTVRVKSTSTSAVISQPLTKQSITHVLDGKRDEVYVISFQRGLPITRVNSLIAQGYILKG